MQDWALQLGRRLVLAGVLVLVSAVAGGGETGIKVLGRRVSFAQRDPRQIVYEFVNYSSHRGAGMFRIRLEELKNDIFANYELAVSKDHGKSWVDTEQWVAQKATAEGRLRRLFLYSNFFDPKNGRLLVMGNEGVLPTDDSLEGQSRFYPIYRVSEDGGRTWLFEERAIQKGEKYTKERPFEGVRVGSNSIWICSAITSRSDGAVIVPAQLSHAGPDGKLYKPPGAYTYLDAAVMIGTWRDDKRLEWQLSQRLHLPPETSIRGIFEPTVAEFPDGRMLMVCRTNSGHKWFSVSRDGGLTWQEPAKWGYVDGTTFYSPSSISRLIRHSSGDTYWFGNISPVPPTGNAPRFPLVIGRVDPKTLRLERETVTTVDTRGPDDPAGLQLSNFCVHEDRPSKNFVMRVTRWDGNTAFGKSKMQGSVSAFDVQVK